jgi:hypothetical protein
MPRPPLWIFYVHSGITLLAARGAIQAQGLAPGQARFVVRRMPYPSPIWNFPHQMLQLPEPSYEIPARPKFWIPRAAIRNFDRALEKALHGRSFVAAIPHSLLPVTKWLSTHRACVGFHYLEEGTASYFPHEPGSHGAFALSQRLVIFLSLGRTHPIPQVMLDYGHPLFRGAMALHPLAFPGAPHRLLVPWISEARAVPGPDAVVALDNSLELGLIDLQTFEEGMRLMARHLCRQGYRQVLVKPHPSHRGDSPTVLIAHRALFEDHSPLHPLAPPQDYFLEQVLMDHKSPLYGIFTSLRLYGWLFGCRVHSPWRHMESYSRRDYAALADTGVAGFEEIHLTPDDDSP